jgi:hypothetical protein
LSPPKTLSAKDVSFIEQLRWITHGTRKQKQAKSHHIEKGYEKRGVSSKEAERGAWQPSTNQIRVAARRAGEVAGRRGANRARANVGEKAAGNESLIVANDIASAAMNY